MSIIIRIEDYLAHYGTPRKSGRYPWGSGKDQKVYEGSFLDITSKLLKEMPATEVARGFGITTSELRARRSIESNERKNEKFDAVRKLAEKQYGASAIGKELGMSESSVRSVMSSMMKERAENIHTIAERLKKEVDDKTYVQIGSGVEHLPEFGISANKLKNAVSVLKEQGYVVHPVQVPQAGSPGNFTTVKVLAPPGTTYQQAKANRDNIRLPGSYSEDGGRTFNTGSKPIINIDPKRVKVVYKEEGGDKADGLIHVRPGVEDVSLGGATYAQVRVGIGGTHYIKGMAVYKDDMPKGKDLVFHTNKSNTGNDLDAMKPQEKKAGRIDPENPFGSTINRQILDPTGKKTTSAMNLLNEEGSWADWNNAISSQVLSKQAPALAKQQLEIKKERLLSDFNEIKSLTNPAVRAHLLEKFADGADSSAVHLDAAHIPRQSTHVILPVQSLKKHQVYAPNYEDGETVVLIRYPHGGKFEIPELQVNNKNREAIKMMGKQAKDAIGIHPDVAKKLSGADFDGDFVLVIPNKPNNPRRIKTEPALKELENFDPHTLYKLPDDVPKMKPKTKGLEMGKVSNLITDMTIKGASNEELSRAVRHSMVVIDAEKHHLDYKKSYRDFGIRALEEKYQGKDHGKAGGASTLISRATSTIRVPETRPRRATEGGPIDPKTGHKMTTPKTWVDSQGNVHGRLVEVARLANTHDAHTLVSKEQTRIELVYADHSNALKSLANEARKELYNFKAPRVNLDAKRVYKAEVDSLISKLKIAQANAPLERQAQIFAHTIVAKQIEANPTMDQATLKKIKGQALATARTRIGANKTKVVPTDREWAAIQAGAISHHQLTQILANTEIDKIRELATPRSHISMSPTQEARARNMSAQGFTQAEIASALGVSTTTVREALK